MALTKASYSMITGAPINVLDFGADPTGTNDSTVAIQKALDVGGNVYLPEGIYKLDSAPITSIAGTRASLSIKSNTRLYGGGTLYSTFVDPNDHDGATLLIANDPSGAIKNVVIDGVHLKTSLAVTTYNYSMINIIQSCDNVVICNCVLSEFTYWGITFSKKNTSNIIIDGNKVFGSRASGIWVGYEAENVIVTNNIVDGTSVAIYGSVDDRILVGNHDTVQTSTVATKNVVISNNICVYTDSKGIAVGSVENCVIDGNVLQKCRLPIMALRDGIFTLYNKNVVISNNTVSNSLVSVGYEPFDRFAFWLQGAYDTKAIGNTVRFDDAATAMWRGIFECDNGCRNVTIENNFCELLATSGAHTNSSRNAIYCDGTAFYCINNVIRSDTNSALFTTGINTAAQTLWIKNNTLYNLTYEGVGIFFSATSNVNIENNRIGNGNVRYIQAVTSLSNSVIRNNDFDNPGANAGSGVYGIRCIELLGAGSTYKGCVIENNNEYDSRSPVPSFVFDAVVYIENSTSWSNVANKNTDANNTNRR